MCISVNLYLCLRYNVVNDCLLLTCFAMTQWVLHKHKMNEIQLKNKQRIQLHSNMSFSTSNNIMDNNQSFTLRDILRDRIGFEAFAQHLITELNSEHLLFLVEVSQYKARLQEKELSILMTGNTKHMDAHLEVDMHLQLAQNIAEKYEGITPESNNNNVSKFEFLSNEKTTDISTFNPLSISSTNSSNTQRLSLPFVKRQSSLSRLKMFSKSALNSITLSPRNSFKRAFILDEENILSLDWLPICEEWKQLNSYQIGIYIKEKYIESMTEHSINISQEHRHSILEFFIEPNFEKNEFNFIGMYHLFDRAFNEVWELLGADSFMRFTCTEQYFKLHRILRKNKSTSFFVCILKKCFQLYLYVFS